MYETVERTGADPKHLLLTLDDIPPANQPLPLNSLLQHIQGLCPTDQANQGTVLLLTLTSQEAFIWFSFIVKLNTLWHSWLSKGYWFTGMPPLICVFLSYGHGLVRTSTDTR